MNPRGFGIPRVLFGNSCASPQAGSVKKNLAQRQTATNRFEAPLYSGILNVHTWSESTCIITRHLKKERPVLHHGSLVVLQPICYPLIMYEYLLERAFALTPCDNSKSR